MYGWTDGLYYAPVGRAENIFPRKILGPKNKHTGLELQNSFKEVARGDQYGKLTIRHHVFRKYVSPNQTLEALMYNKHPMLNFCKS